MDFIQKISRITLFIFCIHCVGGQFLNESSECNTMNDKHWNLIHWFYGKTNHICVTFIANAPGENHQLRMQDTILHGLFERKEYVITYNVVHQNFEEPFVTYAETFTWEGKPFDMRPNQSETVYTRRKRSVQRNDGPQLSVRTEETESGALIIANRISVISRYLKGPARRPFFHPRSLYVIVILDTFESDFVRKSQSVMVKLWKDYGIADAILITPCNGNLELVGTYFPYNRADETNSPVWGEFKWMNLTDMNFRDNSLFRKFENLNEYRLKVSMFPRYPTALVPEEIPDVFLSSYFMKILDESGGYGGIDGLLLGNMARALNFSAVVVAPNGSDFGYRLNTGKFIGSIGDVLYSNSYVSFNGRFMSNYGTDEIEYMFPYYFDKLCVIAPKALKIPEWMAIFKCFHISVWLIILLANAVCGSFWYLLRRSIIMQENTDKTKRQKAVNLTRNKFSMVFIEMWVIMLSGPMTHVPTHIKERIFLTSCLLANLVLAGSFQGSLTRSFSTVSYFKDIETLAELDKSGLIIGTSSGSLRNIFEGIESPLLRSLNSKYIFRNSSIPTRTRTAIQRDICSVERLSDIGLIIATQFEMPDGSVLLHVIRDCPRSYYMSFIVKKGWPLLPAFSNRVRNLFEGGLLQEWYDQVENAIIVQRRYHRQKKSENAKAFTLIDMQTVFYILGISLTMCILVFLGELYIHRRRKAKKVVVIRKKYKTQSKNNWHH